MSPPPPLPVLRLTPHLPATARRLLHILTTITSSSHLPLLLSHILRQHLHIIPSISSSFISACLHLRHLPPALKLFSHLLPFPPLLPSNSLLLALSLLPPSPSSPPPLLILSLLLRSSISPNRFTFPPLLKSLSRLKLLSQGQSVHTHIAKSGLSSHLYTRSSLLNLYSSCGDIDSAQQLFDEMPVKEVIAWTTLIMGYKNCGRLDEALIVFERMQFSGVRPNRVTMVNALDACSAHGALEMGCWIHEQIKRNGWELDVVLGTALVDMYAKCGKIDAGISVFESMEERNVYTWNAVIGGLALAKSGDEAVNWFFRMEEEEGVRPDSITLLGVLSACSHSGLVEMGRRIFNSMMSGDYGFRPGIKHYGCMVDLLARAGFLDEAFEFIERMPFEPNIVIWGSLLGGCRAHGDLRWCEIVARRMMELEPENVAHCVALSNMYAEMGRWREADEVRRVMKERGFRKDAGWSFTESGEI